MREACPVTRPIARQSPQYTARYISYSITLSCGTSGLTYPNILI